MSEEEMTEEQALLIGIAQSHIATITTTADFLHDLGLLAFSYMEQLGKLLPEDTDPTDEQHPPSQEPALTLVKDDPGA